jgi:hypothetical protein
VSTSSANTSFAPFDDVERAFVMQDLRLPRVVRVRARAHARAPQSFEIFDIAAIEQRQWGIALIEDVAAVRDPVVRWMRGQAARVECRRCRDPARFSLLCLERTENQHGRNAAGCLPSCMHLPPRAKLCSSRRFEAA